MAFNSSVEDMFCYSGGGKLHIRTGSFPVQEQVRVTNKWTATAYLTPLAHAYQQNHLRRQYIEDNHVLLARITRPRKMYAKFTLTCAHYVMVFIQTAPAAHRRRSCELSWIAGNLFKRGGAVDDRRTFHEGNVSTYRSQGLSTGARHRLFGGYPGDSTSHDTVDIALQKANDCRFNRRSIDDINYPHVEIIPCMRVLGHVSIS